MNPKVSHNIARNLDYYFPYVVLKIETFLKTSANIADASHCLLAPKKKGGEAIS